MKATCGGCTAEWVGANIAHCSNCHHTFSTVSLFDLHRSASGLRGKCLDPAGLKHERGSKAGRPLLRLSETRNLWVGYERRPEDSYDRAS